MRNKTMYIVAAGLAFGMLSTKAMADNVPYFKVISTQTALTEKADIVPVEKVLTYPVVVERTSTMTTEIAGIQRPVLVEEMTALPVMLEKTTIVKPHRWPLSFGVWP